MREEIGNFLHCLYIHVSMYFRFQFVSEDGLTFTLFSKNPPGNFTVERNKIERWYVRRQELKRKKRKNRNGKKRNRDREKEKGTK